MTEKSLAIVLGPNMLADDLSASEQLMMATQLNKQFETHCVSLREAENPITKFFNDLQK